MYLNNMLIYTENFGQPYINVVWRIFYILKKNGLFANLKKCRFHKFEVCFLGFVVWAQEVQIEDKKIEVVKNWLKPKSVKDI